MGYTPKKNTSNANASTNAPTKQGPSRLHADLAVGHVPSFAAFPYVPKIRAQHLTFSWKSDTRHVSFLCDACGKTRCTQNVCWQSMAIYGNLSVASPAANSRSNCSRLNIHIATLRTWTEETFFCEKSGNGFGVWEIGVWEKIEHLDSKHRFWGPYGRICSLFPQFCCRGVSEVQVADTLNEAVGHGVCTCSRLPGMTLGKPWKPNKKPPV